MNDLILLSALLDGPKHGYQLKREAGWIFGQSELHNNLVYPTLRQFTEKGWVTKKSVPGQRGQTRQQYAITALGRKQLLARLKEYGEAEAGSFSAFLMRVGMFDFLAADDRTRILDLREQRLKENEERFAGLGDHFELGTYAGEVVRYLMQQIHSERMWIRNLRRLSAKSSANADGMAGEKE